MILSHAKHALNEVFVRRMNESRLAQMAFAFGRFLSQQVALKSFIPADLTRTCDLESLFCTGVRLHLWHGLNFGMAKVTESY